MFSLNFIFYTFILILPKTNKPKGVKLKMESETPLSA